MTYEELRRLWTQGGFTAIEKHFNAPILIPLEPWVRLAVPRRTMAGPPVRPRALDDLDVTGTGRNALATMSLVHSQLGDRFPAMGVALQTAAKTDRNVYAHIAVGRSDNNDVVVDQPSVSRFHADLRLVGGIFSVRDAKSRNGTRRNGEPVGDVSGQPLQSGDVVTFGDANFLFCALNDRDLATALGRLSE